MNNMIDIDIIINNNNNKNNNNNNKNNNNNNKPNNYLESPLLTFSTNTFNISRLL